MGSLTEPDIRAPGYDLDVRSGPSGENVTGTFRYRFIFTFTAQPIRCR